MNASVSTLRPPDQVPRTATPPENRGHGYGAAITARAVRDGFTSGARFAWLHSSPEGFGVYEKLGFRTVEEWGPWISEGHAE